MNDIVGVEGGEEGRGGVERRERKGFGVWVEICQDERKGMGKRGMTN